MTHTSVGTQPGPAARVVVVGAGPIGVAVAHEIARRPDLTLVAVVDVDPARHGVTITAGRAGATDVVVSAALPAAGQADVAVVCTTSSFVGLVPTLRACLAHGLHVVSTCEELVWPHLHHAALAAVVDEEARVAGRAIVGTGVNPGFLMDALPALLSSICTRIDKITVVRAQDAATRRLPFQNKVGVGLSVDEFHARVALGGFLHRGLSESAALLGHALGLDVTAVGLAERHAPVIDPVSGRVLGVEQSCTVMQGGTQGGTHEGMPSGGVGARLELRFEAWAGHPSPRDEIVVDGDPPLRLVTTGVHGDVATRAIAVNAIAAVRRAAPGLRTMLDLPLPAGRFHGLARS